MRRGLTLFTILALALATSAFATNKADATSNHNLKFIGAGHEVAPPAVPLSQHRFPNHSSLDELVGTAYEAGHTYYDYQHNGTAGRMIATDETGWVHMVWMNGLDVNNSERHVFYNVWNPSSEAFLYQDEGGIQADASNRAGYTSQATSPDGRCYPAFHQVTTTQDAHAAAAIDFLPQSGAFTTAEPEYLIDSRCGAAEDMEVIWPHISQDINGVIHMVSCENPCTDEAGDPQRIYYSRGIPQFDQFGFGETIDWQPVAGEDQFLEVDTVMVIAPDICSSRHTNRTAMAWAKSISDLESDTIGQSNNNIVYSISEDGGLNWGPEINITRFIEPDYDCFSGDTLECSKDSFRVYTDLNVMFDESDNLHIAFTTQSYIAFSSDGNGLTYTFGYSQIWHWGEATDEISPIRAVFVGYANDNWTGLSDWQTLVQDPRMSIDPVTGDLFVCYQFVDTVSWSAGGIPIADAWVSKSVDCGRSWSEGTNVTNTEGGEGTLAGECQHERDIIVSETVTYADNVGYLHMQYVFDLDAGGAVGETPTGEVTFNPVMYQRIPVSEIPAEPRGDHLYPYIHVDSTQAPYGGDPDPTFSDPCITEAIGDDERSIPNSFRLYQNYPNPFNPSTSIQFDLAKNMNVTLSVFNVLGQEVATLLNNKALSAGVQLVEFDATNLPSGVYVYQLTAEGLSQSRKMVLLK